MPPTNYSVQAAMLIASGYYLQLEGRLTLGPSKIAEVLEAAATQDLKSNIDLAEAIQMEED